MIQQNVNEAKIHLSALINAALKGEEVIIAKAGVPSVKIIPVEQPKKPRVGGQWKGLIWRSDDFDSSDKEIAELIYNSKLFPDEADEAK